MARRSDHTRDELRSMAIAAGQNIIAQEGFSKFSARKVAKEIGYTVGTIYNIFDSHDMLILHINAATLDEMEQFIVKRLDHEMQADVFMKHLAACYLDFARTHYASWSALFEHNLPPDVALPGWYAEKITQLFSLIEQPLLPLLGNPEEARRAAKTLWAAIHGICMLGLSGKLDLVGADPIQALMDELIDHYLAGHTREATP